MLQAGRIGDMILTTPLFHALKRQYPDAALTVFASSVSAIIPESQPVVDRVIEMPRGLLRQIPHFARRLRSDEFDLYIDIKDHRSTTSRVIAEMVHATRKIGHVSTMKRHDHALALPAANPPGHYVDIALAPMKLLAPGVEFDRRPRLEIPIAAYRAIDRQIDPGERGMVTINVSAGDDSRYWDPAKWRRLIGLLARDFSVAVISAPADRGLVDEVCSIRRGARPIRTESILEAAAVVDRSTVVISPDTSIIHVASARNRPCVGLFPNNEANARSFGPLSDHSTIVMTADEEVPLREISVESVLSAFERVMRAVRPPLSSRSARLQ